MLRWFGRVHPQFGRVHPRPCDPPLLYDDRAPPAGQGSFVGRSTSSPFRRSCSRGSPGSFLSRPSTSPFRRSFPRSSPKSFSPRPFTTSPPQSTSAGRPIVVHRPVDLLSVPAIVLSVPAIVPSWLSRVLRSLAVHHEPTTIVVGSNAGVADEPSTMVLCRMSLPVAQGKQGWHTPDRAGGGSGSGQMHQGDAQLACNGAAPLRAPLV